MKCYECSSCFREDYLKGRTALRCGETGRVTDVYPTAHVAAVQDHMAPAWCPKEMEATV